MGKGSSSDRARTQITIGRHAAAAVAVASDASTLTVPAWWWYSRGDANPAAAVVVPDV